MRKNTDLNRIAVAFSIVIFLVYLSTMSISLDDEDSAHFALGLREFNVTNYQPHPPGFPLYMVLGMFFDVFFMNELLTLTFMSALFGALSVFVFYLLVGEMFNKKIALASSVLMSITPLFWLNGVKAMSDMTGLFFTLASMFFVYRYIGHKKPVYFYVAAALSGLAIGVRIHLVFILLPLLFYSSYLRRNHIRINLRGGIIFLIAIVLCFLPMILITGIPEYFSSAQDQLFSRVDQSQVSVIGTDLTLDYIGQRLFSFPYFFLFGGYGINLGSLGMLSTPLLAFMSILIIFSLKRIDLRDKRLLFFASGIIPYLLIIFIMLPPFNPRYLLILVPVLSLIFVNSIWKIKKLNIRYILFGALGFLVLSHSIFLASEISTTPAAPVQMIIYVNENYGSDTIILGGFAEKYFDFYNTNLTVISGRTSDCERTQDLLLEGRKVLTLIGNECSNLRPILIDTFSRDSRIHIKRSVINLYELLLV